MYNCTASYLFLAHELRVALPQQPEAGYQEASTKNTDSGDGVEEDDSWGYPPKVCEDEEFDTVQCGFTEGKEGVSKEIKGCKKM